MFPNFVETKAKLNLIEKRLNFDNIEEREIDEYAKTKSCKFKAPIRMAFPACPTLQVFSIPISCLGTIFMQETKRGFQLVIRGRRHLGLSYSNRNLYPNFCSCFPTRRVFQFQPPTFLPNPDFNTRCPNWFQKLTKFHRKN